MKLKTQIFLIGLLLSTLPLALISTGLILFYNNELDRVAADELSSITSAQVDIIDNFFNERDVNLSILSEYDMLQRLLEGQYDTDSAGRQVDRAAMEEIFKVQESRRDYIYSITAIDLEYRIVACTEPVEPENDRANAISWQLADLGREVRFSRILEAGELGTLNRCLVATKAVYNEQDERIGYLIEEVALGFFENLRIETNLIQDGTIYVADGQGGLITAGTVGENREDYVLADDERGGFSDAWAERDQSVDVGVIRYQIDGRSYLSGYGGVPNSAWQIISTVCLDDILHTRENMLQVAVAVALVALLLAVALNVVMRRTLAGPIERMVAAFAEIRGKGDFSRRITDVPHNELGVVAGEVNHLLADIETTLLLQAESLAILKERSERDALTGLFNRSAMREVVTMKLDGARVNRAPLACILVDIDDFKYYNTRFGHAGGDRVIQFVSSLMRELSADTAGRIGGDEFFMCLDGPGSDLELACRLDGFVRELREGTDVAGDGVLVPVRCSIGAVQLTDQTGQTYETVTEQADQAMYRIKNSTKDGYHIASRQAEK